SSVSVSLRSVRPLGRARSGRRPISYADVNGNANRLVGAHIREDGAGANRRRSSVLRGGPAPRNRTQAKLFLPRRSTRQPPCSRSVRGGSHSGSEMRSLFPYAPPSEPARRAAPLLSLSPLATSRSMIPDG